MTGAPILLLPLALAVLFAALPLAGLDRRAAYGATLVGSGLLLLAAAASAAFGPPPVLSWASPLGGAEGIGLDGLSAYFALIAAVVWIGTTAFARRDDRERSPAFAAAYAVTIASIALLLSARDSIVFLLGWEGMTLGVFAMILRGTGPRPRVYPAAFLFLAFGEGSTLALLLAFAGLRAGTGSFQWAALSDSGGLGAAIFLSALVGFGLKMGVAPFQMGEWRPIAHAAPPVPASAVLSATVTLAGVYGLFRVVMLLGTGPDAWGGALMIGIGAVTALLGALLASVSEHTQALPAYSTIENNGLVLVALGVALTARAEGLTPLFTFALFAALFQVFAHAIAKAALFLYAGYLERRRGTFDLNPEGRAAKEPPGPAEAGALLAGLSLAAAPPMAGFVSEWMILEALFQSYEFTGPGLRFVGLLAGAAVALAAGLMAVAMVKFLGFARWGRPSGGPTGPAGRARGAAVLGLSGVVLGLGIGAPLVLALAAVPARSFVGHAVVVPVSTAANLAVPAGWTILSGSPFGLLSPPAVPILIGAGLLVGLGYFALGGGPRWRRSEPWMAGNATEDLPAERYTAFGFSTGLRVMFSSLLGTREVRRRTGAVHRAELATPEPYDVEGEGIDPLRVVYDELVGGALALSGLARSAIMPGRLGQYVAYLLVTAVVVIGYLAWAR